MAARSVLTAIRRHRVRILASALLVAYGGCRVPWGQLDHEYGATVVDRETGEPIEGAVMVVSWGLCVYLHMECGSVTTHSAREGVSGPDGRVVVDGTPGPIWDPMMYRQDPDIEIRAFGYVPFERYSFADPKFAWLRGEEYGSLFRSKPEVELSKPEHFDAWFDSRQTPREEYREAVTRPTRRYRDVLDELPEFRRVLNRERARFGLSSL